MTRIHHTLSTPKHIKRKKHTHERARACTPSHTIARVLTLTHGHEDRHRCARTQDYLTAQPLSFQIFVKIKHGRHIKTKDVDKI